MNGGTCIDGVDNFTCSCPPKLTGPLCECLILGDGTQDCKYVSPTPETDFTYVTTHSYENTTDIITTTFTMITDIPPKVFSTENDLSSTIVTPSAETITEKELTTKESSTTDTTTVEDASNITRKDITDTTQPMTEEKIQTKPIESDDSKTEPTIAECKDLCNTSTVIIPAMTESESPSITTESYRNSTTSTKSPPISTEISLIPSTLSTTKNAEPTIITTELTTVTITEAATITTTTQIELTTDKMFTDIPIEYPITEILTAATVTTEATESTTISDDGDTTIQSECTESYCNEHGTCTNSIHGIRVCILYNINIVMLQ